MKWSQIPLFWRSTFLFWQFEITDSITIDISAFIHYRIIVYGFSVFYRLAIWYKSVDLNIVGTNFSNIPFENTGLHIWNYFSGYGMNLSFIFCFSLNLAYLMKTCQFVNKILLISQLFKSRLWLLKYHICNDSGYRLLSPPNVTSHLWSIA